MPVFLLCLTAKAASQEYNPESSQEPAGVQALNTLDFSPFALLIGMASMEYQHAVSDDLSLALRGSYWRLGFGDWRVGWRAVGVGLRRYWGHRAPRGGYVAVNADVGVLEATFSGELDMRDTVVAFNVIPNIMLGYSWLWGGFHMDAGIGASYLMGNVVVLGESFPYRGLYPTAGFNIGFGI